MPAAGTPSPITADFAVTTDGVRNAAIAKLAGVGAGYVVVSEGIGSLGAPAGIFATVYDGNGNAGPQIQINNPATPDILGINQPSVAALSGGGFVVTWHSPRDSSYYIEDVWARVFTGGGAPVADQFKVSPLTSVPTEQRQVYPTVIGGADNGFTVAWWEQPSGSPGPGRNSFDVLYRSFDGAGVATGDPAVLAMPVTGWQMHPSAAAFADGVPAFVWARGLADPSPGIGYAWAGVDGGIPDTQASSSGFSSPPAIAVLSDDRVAIVWARDVGGSQGLDISAQVLNRNGTVSVATFSVVTDAGAQSQPDILELNDGGFLISWLSGGVLVAQRYASSGAALGDRFQVAQSDSQAYDGKMGGHLMDQMANGDIVFVWHGQTTGGSSVNGIYSRKYSLLAQPTEGPDVLEGSTVGDTINALGGDDSVRGLDGNDSLLGGSGNDTLQGEAGNDTLTGGLGDDSLEGGDNTDLISYADAAAGITFVLAASGSGSFNAGSLGTDTYTSIEGVIGSAQADSLTGNTVANALRGGAGNDTLLGGLGNDTLLGEAGDDTLTGGAGDDSLDGGSEFDLIDYTDSWVGITFVLGASGAGTFVAGSSFGTDTYTGIEGVIGTDFDDSITGNAVANILRGGDGNDTLVGGAGNDTLMGGVFNDTLRGGDGDDSLDGGSNNDVIDYSDAAAGITFALGASGSGSFNAGSLGTDTYTNMEGVIGTALADSLTGNAVANVLSGGAGNDTIEGGLGNDTMVGEGGTGDMLSFASFAPVSGVTGIVVNLGAQNVPQNTNAGTDLFLGFEGVIGSAFNDQVTGGATSEALFGGAGNDTVIGGAGFDTLTGGLGDDSLDGGNDLDFIDYGDATAGITFVLGASGSGSFTSDLGTDTYTSIECVIGTALADTITGNGVANALRGGTGNDTLIGGAGDDTLVGGSGSDSIDGGDGIDRVDYASATASVSVDLLGTNGVNGFAADGLGFFDALTGIENVNSGTGADSVFANNAANRI